MIQLITDDGMVRMMGLMQLMQIVGMKLWKGGWLDGWIVRWVGGLVSWWGNGLGFGGFLIGLD